jgi:cytoplasmic iron level regulating protein YaaA (DUF328/UPF0246 family)
MIINDFIIYKLYLKMKILFLIAPSEWKNNNIDWKSNWVNKEYLNFNLKKPKEIALNASEKDLKCSWERYKQWIKLNKILVWKKDWEGNKDKKIDAIYRYSGVMYKFIDYINMSAIWKKFMENNFVILSGIYGMVWILDKIWNYKLPIETKWLYEFWWDKILDNLIEIKPEYIVNLLPMSYAKLAIVGKWKNKKITDNNIKIININFLKSDWSKVAHGVKKLRWEWIKNICDNEISDYRQFGWEILDNKEKNDTNIIDINIAYK